MIQFVGSAQLFLMLWLFAATAPAATALVNGSLDALIDVHTIGLRAANSSRTAQQIPNLDQSRGIRLDLQGHGDIAKLILLALAEKDTIFHTPEQIRSSTVVPEAHLALSSSILHTEVQRHRPRWA